MIAAMIGEVRFVARKTVGDVVRMKQRGQTIVWVPCYDCSVAQVAEQAGLDMRLVGDSGRAVWGSPPITPL